MDAAAADAEEAAAAAHHEAAQRQAADGAAGDNAGGASPDSRSTEDGEEADRAEADAPEEDAPSGTTKKCMECGEEKVGLLCVFTLLQWRDHRMNLKDVPWPSSVVDSALGLSMADGQGGITLQHALVPRRQLRPAPAGQAIEDFPRNRRRLDGRDNRCKRCTARMVSSRLKAKAPVMEPTGERHLCGLQGVRVEISRLQAPDLVVDGQ
jgi:hypothetical protein